MTDILNGAKWRVDEGDCLTLLRGLPDGCVDFIATDPPYRISQTGQRITRNGGKYGEAADIDLDFGEWDAQWETEADYLDWCYEWLTQAARVLSEDSHMVFFFNWSLYYPIAEFVTKHLGMRARQPLYWVKANPAPRARKVDFMKSHETAFWFTNGVPRQDRFAWSMGQQLDYVHAAVPHFGRFHPTQKAEEPFDVWTQYLCPDGGLVLDPFSGSGTTGAVAARLGRRFIGCELSPKYAAMSRERIAQAETDRAYIERGLLPHKPLREQAAAQTTLELEAV